MNPRRFTLMVLATVPLLVLLSLGCSSHKSDDTQMAEQAPPPSTSSDAEMAGSTAPEPPPPPPVESRTTTPTRPQRTSTIPEERPRAVVPQQPPPVVLTLPAGTSLAVNLTEPITSEHAMPGDRVRATLKNAVLVGDRVAF